MMYSVSEQDLTTSLLKNPPKNSDEGSTAPNSSKEDLEAGQSSDEIVQASPYKNKTYLNVACQSAPTLSQALLFFVCVGSAVQPAMNSWLVAAKLTDSQYADCKLAEISCYSDSIQQPLPVMLVAAGFIVNAIISYIFIPQTITAIYEKAQKLFKTPEGPTDFLAERAELLGCGLGLLSFAVFLQLSMDALHVARWSLGDTPGSLMIDVLMMILNIVANTSTRIIGSMRVMKAMLIWLPHTRYDKWAAYLPFLSEKSREYAIENLPVQRGLLTAVFHYAQYRFDLSEEVQAVIEAHMQDGNLEAMYRAIYYGTINKSGLLSLGKTLEFGTATWKGWPPKAVCCFIAILSLFIINNVVDSALRNLFTTGSSSLDIMVNALFVIPTSFYYIFSLNRLVDLWHPAYALAKQTFQTQSQWSEYSSAVAANFMLIMAVIVAVFSSGNLLFSGYDQASNGKLSIGVKDKAFEEILWGGEGALISGLVNLFSLLQVMMLALNGSRCDSSNKAMVKAYGFVRNPLENVNEKLEHLISNVKFDSSLANNPSSWCYQDTSRRRLNTAESHKVLIRNAIAYDSSESRESLLHSW